MNLITFKKFLSIEKLFAPRTKSKTYKYIFCIKMRNSRTDHHIISWLPKSWGIIQINCYLFIGIRYKKWEFKHYWLFSVKLGVFFCVGLGSMFYLSCFDSCLQTYVLRKIKTERFMLCLSINITWNETWNNQVLLFASLLC